MTARCSSAGIVSELSGDLSAKRSNASVTGPPAGPGRTGAGPSLGRLRAILDLGQKLGFNPDALVADALGIGPGPSNEGFKPLLQISGRDLVEAVVDFAGVDQIVALAPADVEPVPLRTVECETDNGQRLPLRAEAFSASLTQFAARRSHAACLLTNGIGRQPPTVGFHTESLCSSLGMSKVRDRWPPIIIVATSGRIKLGPGDLPEGVFCQPTALLKS